MDFLELTLPTLPENLALDEALLLEAEAGAAPLLRLWTWPTPAVVLGAAGIIADDVHDAACARDSVPLARRGSGGGTVLLGSGCLIFSLVLDMTEVAELQHISPSYRFILGQAAAALAPLHPGIELAGISDLAACGRKFCGNAQQRKRRCLLHHGTILHDFDLALPERYLKLPPRQPAYRNKRSHREFLMNLPLAPALIRDRLRSAWRADQPRSDWPAREVEQLVAEKYAADDWIRRR
jgi:lipoate-protein ligase A